MRWPGQIDRRLWHTGTLDGRPIADALRRRDFAAIFRFLRTHGWSRARISAATGLAESRVREIANGNRLVSTYEVIERIAEGLNIDRGLLGLAYTAADQPVSSPGFQANERKASALGTAEPGDLGFHPGRQTAGDDSVEGEHPQRRTAGPSPDVLWRVTAIVVRGAIAAPLHERIMDLFPPVGMDVPRRIGAADVTRIEATTSAFRDWDNRWGGGLSRAAVVAQLQWVAATASRSVCSSEAVKNRLLTALADLAGVAAFLSYDLNHHDQARALWTIGLEAASEADNVDLIGATLRQLAHQALHLDRAEEALRLVRLAYAATVNPAYHTCELALAEIAAYEGWCYAAAGKPQPCHRALGRAQEHFENADGEQAPPWLNHLDAAELTALRGHTYHVLAYREPEMADDAQRLLRRAVADRDSAYARSRTLNLIALAGTFFQRGDHLEEGVAVGDRALRGAGTLTSPRALDRLRALKALTDRHATVPVVAEFRHRIDAVCSDA